MVILFECACGHEISVPEAHAGKVEKCPSCRMSVLVPEPSRPASRTATNHGR